MLIKDRYDYFLIWGNGLKYKSDILEEIRKNEDFEIVRIQQYMFKSINRLISNVYGCDYAPLHHLKDKTKYLKTTVPEVMFIFIKNRKPNEDYFGEGSYRHMESITVKQFKEKIRNKFNDYENGKRTENHVIHASDNELQTDQILKFIGFKDGLKYLKKNSELFVDIPYFIDYNNNFKIKNVPISSLSCNIVTGNDLYNYNIENIKIEESPQYLCICGKKEIYRTYINKFLGGPLTCDYSVEKLMNLKMKFKYLEEPYRYNYIVVTELNDSNYLILDGLHRASILKYMGKKFIKVMVI